MKKEEIFRVPKHIIDKLELNQWYEFIGNYDGSSDFIEWKYYKKEKKELEKQ